MKNEKEPVIVKIYNEKLIDSLTLNSTTSINISLIHVNISKTYHFIKNLNMVVMEYINNGLLSKFVVLNKNHLQEKYSFLIIMQIIQCIDYLHNTKKISHNNLTIDKFLVNEKFELKLTELSNKEYNKSPNIELFAAPEIKINDILKKKTDYFKCDIYSLGILFYFVLNKEYPKIRNNKKKSNLYDKNKLN